MVAARKGRLNLLTDRVAQDQKMGEVKNFKIYAEVDQVKNREAQNNGTKGKAVPFNGGRYLSIANDSKSGIKNMEKNKSKQDESLKPNVRRKVLADIGNVKDRLSRIKQRKNSELWKGKEGRISYPQSRKHAVDSGNTEASSSGKPSKGKGRVELIQSAEDNQTLKKQAVNENIKATSDEPRTKFQGRNSVAATATNRKSVRIPLHLTRKSLPVPVLKQASQVEDSGTSEKSSEKSGKSRGKHGFPVKPNSRKSIVPKPSNLRSRPLGNIKATSDERRANFQGRNSVAETATNRNTVRIPLHLTRKSLPVLKQASQVEASGTSKKSSEKSEKSWAKHGFPVKPSSRRSIVPKPSNIRSRPWANRVSDGFVVMASRAQAKVDTGVLSRKSIKSSVKTKLAALNTRRNSNSNRNDSSLSKDIPSVISNEEPNVSVGNTTDIIARRKSDRRNSFTCSLISRSKLLEESRKVETLPNIYDDRNHLEVSDYVDDIYKYYWVMEAQNPTLKNYMEIQREITPQMRGILINWLIEVHLKFELMDETLFLTVTLLDRYLSLESIKKNEMQLVGLTSLLLASKYEDFWHPRVNDLIGISAESYSRDQMLKMEKTMLQKLKFRLNQPTLYVFMLRFLKAAQLDMKFEHLAFYLIELCLVEYKALKYKPSMLCASAIYVARCTMKVTPPWTPLLAKHARYQESQIRDCAEMILKFHKSAKTTLLKVAYEKYTKPDCSRVAHIKPLDRLPV